MTPSRSVRSSPASVSLHTLLLACAVACSAGCGGASSATGPTGPTGPTACSDLSPCPSGQRCVATACVAAECAPGETRACGPQAVGACLQGTQACVAGAFEAGCPGQVLPSAETCDAGAIDEDCDGAANEGCACAPVSSTVACCGDRGVQTCLATAGGSAYSACSVAPVEEACNGIDDDCDGLTDEEATPLCGGGAVCTGGACACAGGAAPLACLADADGDLRSLDLTTLTSLCPVTDRPEAGHCPTGYLLPSVAQGLDCDDADPTRFSLLSLRSDQDGDTFCAGAATVQCAGAAPPAGLRASGSCQATDDCNDANAAVFAVATVRADADGDTYCTGAAFNQCSGASLPAGLRRPAECQPTDDCNDTDAATFTIVTVRADADGDTYCTGAAFNRCSGASLPAGLRLPATCAGEDCRDGNPLATTICTFPAGYLTGSAVKACAFVPPTETFNVSAVQLCPFGFQLNLASLFAQRLAGSGTCVAVTSTSVQITCNGLDGATCRVAGNCDAL